MQCTPAQIADVMRAHLEQEREERRAAVTLYCRACGAQLHQRTTSRGYVVHAPACACPATGRAA